MEDTENEKKITLSDIMENLDNYMARKIKRLASVLIDSVCELTTEMKSKNLSLIINLKKINDVDGKEKKVYLSL